MKNKTYDILFIILMLYIIFAIAYIGACSAAALSENPYDADTVIYVFNEHERMEMEKYTELYCSEIDSLVYSYGMEIDADRVDIENDTQMEQAAYELLGDKFYTWRQRESKYAWIRDVFIARYCY